MPRFEPHTIACGLCGRAFARAGLTKHHCVPKSKGGTNEHIELLCGQCHSMVHATFTNATLEAVYPTLAQLRTAPELTGYIRWVRKQPPTRRTKNAPRRRKV
jgi:5-methylcytosine-specific restriction endonuclease McrA